MKKLITALGIATMLTYAVMAESEVTNNVVNVAEISVAATVYPTAGASVITEAENIRNELLAFSGSTASAVTNTKMQEIWVPVGVATDVNAGTASSVISIGYRPSGSSTLFNLGSITQVGGSETYTPFAGYPSLASGDSLVLTAASTDTTNSYSVTFIKKVIPR